MWCYTTSRNALRDIPYRLSSVFDAARSTASEPLIGRRFELPTGDALPCRFPSGPERTH